MRKGALLISIMAALLISTGVLFAQNKPVVKKEIVVNPDGSYSVIEYPVGKEVMVNLVPAGSITGTGMARVVRSADGTKVYVDMSGVPADVTNYYAYAVDPTGTPTLLGPITFQKGVAKAEFATPLNQFMVVLSPTEGLTTIDTSTAVVFRSDVPKGYAIIPRKSVGDTKAAGVAASTISAYDVPLLNIATYDDKERELKVKFTGDLSGLEGKAYLARKKGTTKVKMHFDDMNKVPKGKRFVLWASAPDGTYTKLGQVMNSGKRDEAAINSETSLADFGLFMTVEDAEVAIPTSRIYSVFTVPSS
ncbi:MAG TPA: hypothetical protein VGQ55_11330 [Pyrinomonadaceae bacterium]|nr:hypothetical protein [Pyrinomonadaceae bacterium]